MIPLTISLAALALSVCALWLAFRQNGKLVGKCKILQMKIDRYIKANNCTTPTYFVNKTIDGRIGVERGCLIDGHIHSTVIKLFTDPDQDFNRRGGVELVEKLNEK